MKKKNATKKNSTTASTAKTAKTAKAPKGKAGRPLYVPKFPRKEEWTMNDFCRSNEVDVETGKGPRCSKLTLIKWLSRDKARKGRSLVKRLDHTAPPSSENGLGRKAFLFSLREKLAPEVAPEATPEVTPEVTPDNSSYEEQKAALLSEPTPVISITTPEVTPEATPEVVATPETAPAV